MLWCTRAYSVSWVSPTDCVVLLGRVQYPGHEVFLRYCGVPSTPGIAYPPGTRACSACKSAYPVLLRYRVTLSIPDIPYPGVYTRVYSEVLSLVILYSEVVVLALGVVAGT